MLMIKKLEEMSLGEKQTIFLPCEAILTISDEGHGFRVRLTSEEGQANSWNNNKQPPEGYLYHECYEIFVDKNFLPILRKLVSKVRK